MTGSQPVLSFLKDPKLIYCYISGNNLLTNTLTHIFTVSKRPSDFIMQKSVISDMHLNLKLAHNVSVAMACKCFISQTTPTFKIFYKETIRQYTSHREQCCHILPPHYNTTDSVKLHNSSKVNNRSHKTCIFIPTSHDRSIYKQIFPLSHVWCLHNFSIYRKTVVIGCRADDFL